MFIHACRRALGKHEEAITHYIKRVQMGRWDEERFMSALNIADISRVLWERGHLISPQVSVATLKIDVPADIPTMATLVMVVPKHCPCHANLAVGTAITQVVA